MLQEGDERRGHRDDLLRRHVHVVDRLRARRSRTRPRGAGQDRVLGNDPPVLAFKGALAWAMMCFSSVVGRQPLDLVGDLAVLHLRYGVWMNPNSLTLA